jgi:hypothetical protein
VLLEMWRKRTYTRGPWWWWWRGFNNNWDAKS